MSLIFCALPFLIYLFYALNFRSWSSKVIIINTSIKLYIMQLKTQLTLFVNRDSNLSLLLLIDIINIFDIFVFQLLTSSLIFSLCFYFLFKCYIRLLNISIMDFRIFRFNIKMLQYIR